MRISVYNERFAVGVVLHMCRVGRPSRGWELTITGNQSLFIYHLVLLALFLPPHYGGHSHCQEMLQCFRLALNAMVCRHHRQVPQLEIPFSFITVPQSSFSPFWVIFYNKVLDLDLKVIYLTFISSFITQLKKPSFDSLIVFWNLILYKGK